MQAGLHVTASLLMLQGALAHRQAEMLRGLSDLEAQERKVLAATSALHQVSPHSPYCDRHCRALHMNFVTSQYCCNVNCRTCLAQTKRSSASGCCLQLARDGAHEFVQQQAAHVAVQRAMLQDLRCAETTSRRNWHYSQVAVERWKCTASSAEVVLAVGA